MLLRHYGLAALLLTAPLAAQQPAPSPPASAAGQDVVVTAARDPEREVQAFVEALTPASGGARAQLSRFETRRVCPTVIGVAPAQRDAIVARMRRVAAAAGAPVAGARCHPNVVLAVAADKRAFIELLAHKYPEMLGELSSREAQQLAQSPGPAAAWQLAGPLLNADGVEIPDPKTGEVAANQTVAAGSRITAASRPHVAAAMVVVERAALVGLTITQLADYATVRALSRADPAALGGSAAPTILTVLEAAPGSETPVTLTSWDMDFLKALYVVPENIYAASQRSAIRRGMAHSLRQDAPRPAAGPTTP